MDGEVKALSHGESHREGHDEGHGKCHPETHDDGLKITFDVSNGIDPERAAMMLALTRTREEEEAVKQVLSRLRVRFAVTEIGGITENLRSKIAPQVIGACLSQGVIRKCPSHTHALLHAILEAERGLMMDASMSGSMSLKIAVTTHGSWIAVAIFGQSAFHVLTNHRRAGLGTMHFDGAGGISGSL